MVCNELELPEPEFVTPATLKKWAMGNGHASKEQMMDACRWNYGITPVDDNMADACLLFYYFPGKHRL